MTITTQHARVLKWNDLAEDKPMEKIARRRIMGEKMMISRVQLTKGFQVPAHQHENEQFAVVLEGEMEFGLDGDGGPDSKKVIVKTGEVMQIPSNVRHSARALRDTLILDIFSPPSEKTGVDQR